MTYDKDYLLSRVKQLINLDEKLIFNIYWYGSHIYGTNNDNSDYDFMVVIDDRLEAFNDRELKTYDNLINVHLETYSKFQEHLNDMKFKELEIYFLPEEYVLQSKKSFKYKLDLSKLRKEISSKSNNSWAKAHKKLELNYEDDYIGLKSLFHSLRILDFGEQIATNNCIDFSSVSHLYFDIINHYNNGYRWQELKDLFQPIYNSMATKFKFVAPK